MRIVWVFRDLYNIIRNLNRCNGYKHLVLLYVPTFNVINYPRSIIKLFYFASFLSFLYLVKIENVTHVVYRRYTHFISLLSYPRPCYYTNHFDRAAFFNRLTRRFFQNHF